MSTYHLHARLFEGPLDDPSRNELQSRESDDFDEVLELARVLVDAGFCVWVYTHEHHPALNGDRSPYRVVAEWGRGGARRW